MTNRQVKKDEKFYFDWILLGILGLFMVVSLVAIYKAGNHLGISTSGLVARQGMWYGLGFVTIFVLIKLGPEILYRASRIFYFIFLFLLAFLVLVKYTPALHGPLEFLITEVNGAWAWYQLPGAGTFQPSEFMKIWLVFITADVIHQHNSRIGRSNFKNDLKLFFKIGLWVLPPLVLIFLQPDTGLPLIIVISIIFMMYVAGTKNYWFLGILVGLVLLYFGVIYLYYNHPDILGNLVGGSSSNQYKLRRFFGWLEYEKYAQTWGYQLYNSLIALGMGGPTGLTESNFIVHISEAQTDFIFSVIGSQFGLFGSLAVIGLCLILNLKLIVTAITSIDSKSKYIIGGILGIFMYQQIQNISMMIGLLPITGITLPLISYGGSSLISYMIALSYPFMVYSHTKNNPVYEESRMPSYVSEKVS